MEGRVEPTSFAVGRRYRFADVSETGTCAGTPSGACELNATLFLNDACYVRRVTLALRDVDPNVSVHLESMGDEVELRAGFGTHVTESAIRDAVADCTGVTDFSIDAGNQKMVREAWAAYR